MNPFKINVTLIYLLFLLFFTKNIAFTQSEISKTAEALTSLAANYYSLTKFDSAEYYLRKSLEVDSNYNLTYYWLGLIEFNIRKKEAKAEKYFLRAAMDENPGEDVFAYLGAIYLNKSDYKKAEIYFKKGLEIESDDDVCMLSLIGIYLKTERPKDALKLSDQFLGTGPLLIRKLINLAIVYEENKSTIEAERIYKKIISVDSNNAFAYYKLGRLYTTKDRIASAEQAFNKAISMDSSYSLSYFSSYVEEEAAFKKANGIKANHSLSFIKLAWLYVITDHFYYAERAYKKAIELDSNSAIAYNNLGWLYILTNQLTEAKTNLTRANVLDTTFVNTITFLAMLDFQANRLKEAEQGFLKSIQLNPDFTPAMFGMTYILSTKGQYEDAFKFLEQAIQKKLSIGQLRKLANFTSLNGICLLHSLQGLTYEMLQHDAYLASLRKQFKWNELMLKHFPKEIKN